MLNRYAFLSFCLISLFVLPSCSPSSEHAEQEISATASYLYEQKNVIQTIDDRDLIFFVDRPEISQKVPILLSVDGSSCIGQLRPGVKDMYKPNGDSPVHYARVMVEKPGVDPEAGYPSECSDDFLKYYTIEQRVIDHLRVLQHLNSQADWFNGEVYIWGWSDGGDIAAQLVAYYPNVERAVLGAMGGGYTMAEHFRDFWVCPADKLEGQDRKACLDSLETQFQEMFDNPTWKKTWSGHDNSWKIWPTRLNSRLSNVLKDNQTPILIMQGEADFNSTPAASARKLIKDLEAADNPYFTYWEIPGMKHSWKSLPETQYKFLEDAMLMWLFDLPLGEYGPPHFGVPSETDVEPHDNDE